MPAFMIEPIFWNWLILAGLLLLFEIFTTSFFFIFWAMAALIVALLTYFMPSISWQWQILSFALLSLPALMLWWFIAKNWQADKDDAASRLNNRGRYLIGRQYILKTPIEQQYGRLQIDDSIWTVHGEDMPAGTKIIVTDIESSTLHVSRVDS